MIEGAPDLAAREPGACGGDGLSDGQPIGYLRISPVHAIERDAVAAFVAYGDAHMHVGCRAFATAASTIEFASARVSVTTRNIPAALPAYPRFDQPISS